jgi:thiol-disulfide isomerase/thioredoxin
MRTMISAVAALSLSAACIAAAPARTLTIGDNAPPVEVTHWLKGEPVAGFEPGKIYVVEFWATWCGPCRASIPHIGDLQQQFKDYGVTFLGVSDEELPTVVKWLAKADSEGAIWYDKIRYTVATDPDRSVHDAWMSPAAQNGIPTAFIVGRDSRIEWIGHPVEIDPVLAAVVRDEWDRAASKAAFEERMAPVRESMIAREAATEAAAKGNWDAAAAAVEGLIEKYPSLRDTRNWLFRKMIREADPQVTFAYGRTAMKASWDEAAVLNGLAWTTVDDARARARDLDFAMEAAQRAVDVSESKDPSILDTLARVYFEKDDLKAAIRWQREAVEKAGDAPMAADLKETLIKYEKKATERRGE